MINDAKDTQFDACQKRREPITSRLRVSRYHTSASNTISTVYVTYV